MDIKIFASAKQDNDATFYLTDPYKTDLKNQILHTYRIMPDVFIFIGADDSILGVTIYNFFVYFNGDVMPSYFAQFLVEKIVDIYHENKGFLYKYDSMNQNRHALERMLNIDTDT